MAQFLDYTGLGHFKDKNDALYAKQDGSYSDLTAGLAEQLQSTVGIEDQTPYNFHTSGGSTEIGDREELNAVVGVSVPWNQLVQNGNFSSNTNWSWRLSGGGAIESGEAKLVAVNTTGNNQMYQNISLPANRKFLVTFSARKGADNSFSVLKVALASDNALNVTKEVTLGTTKAGYAVIMTHTASSDNLRFALSASSLSVGDTAYISNVNLFDLTAMFGSTIADYIYALEQSNAGAGVAYFRKLFPKPYYANNSGEMLSVRTNLHKMVGFNQWDEEWELGYYNVDTGASTSSNSNIRCKNKIKVVPNTTYYIKAPNTLWILEYDANDIYLNKYISKTNQVFTTSANTQYIRFYAVNSYGTTYKHDICINLHWDGERDGEYAPFEQNTYALDGTKEWRGIFRLDANNNLYADGDIYPPSGEAQRRYEIVDLGTLDWQKTSGKNNLFNTRLPLSTAAYGGSSDAVCNAVCAKYVAASTTNTYSSEIDKTVSFTSSGYCYIEDSAYSDAATFKTSLSGVYLVYKLETPTTESASPYQQTQIVDDFGTEEFVDAAVEANERDVAIPVGNETVYKPNLRAKLEMAPDSPSNGDGLYVVQQISGENTYVPLVVPDEIPDAPTTDGTYVLKATVADGTATYSWVSE